MAKRFGLRVIMVLGLLCGVAAWSSGQAATALNLKIAFVQYQKPDYKALPFTKPVKLTDGTQFRLFCEVSAPAFVYVLYEDAAGTLTPLYQGPLAAGRGLYLPSDTENFTLEPPSGTEKLTVLASVERQTKLEKLISGSALDVRAVGDELVRIRQAGSTLAEAPERPAPMGGVTRGIKTEAMKATEFTGQTTYVKTIRIEH